MNIWVVSVFGYFKQGCIELLYMCWCTYMCISVGNPPRKRRAGSRAHVCSALSDTTTSSPKPPTVHLTSSVWVTSHLWQHLVLSVVLILDLLVGVQMYHNFISIRNFLMTNEVEHLFTFIGHLYILLSNVYSYFFICLIPQCLREVY